MPVPTIPMTADDIQALIDAQASEGDELEFKAALSGRDGAPDPWMLEQKTIGKTSKIDLTKEVIAFANTRGGVLVLGIAEDGEKRAAELRAIPKCRELADRIGASIAVTADPPITALEAYGIETEPDGAGVVVLRVSASSRAPHRDKDSREAYQRVADRSEPMSMRTIQDLTILRLRSLQGVQSALDLRSAKMASRLSPALSDARLVARQPCTIRATIAPVEPVAIDDLQSRRDLRFSRPGLRVAGREMLGSHDAGAWQPILRGIEDPAQYSVSRRIWATGMIETGIDQLELEHGGYSPIKVGFPIEWVIGTFAQALLLAEGLRSRLQRPALEMVIDLEWRFPKGARVLPPGWPHRLYEPLEEVSRLSDYSMPDRAGLPHLMNRIEADFWSSLGEASHAPFEIDFDAALAQMLGTRY